MIHTLQDLAYAYNVAEPVREMLFALMDRITELEAQRKPLTDGEIWQIATDCTIGGDLHADKFARAIEQAHNIKEGT
jgi:hypothetical protein